MKVKTSELSGAALDWAVAVAEGYKPSLVPIGRASYRVCVINVSDDGVTDAFTCLYSSSWAQCGPLIEKHIATIENVAIGFIASPHSQSSIGSMEAQEGETLLIAACRAIVASQLGDEVDIPEELL